MTLVINSHAPFLSLSFSIYRMETSIYQSLYVGLDELLYMKSFVGYLTYNRIYYSGMDYTPHLVFREGRKNERFNDKW